MVLVTGPTGSGKTTTLYACLSEIQTVEDKIVTIEDPVEYQLRGITQIPVNEKKGLTFARGLRSILRHDPDKIMVGEIRDEDTAQIAVQSALTGHLVFTTVHANNVVDVLGRFLNMKVELYNFVSALELHPRAAARPEDLRALPGGRDRSRRRRLRECGHRPGAIVRDHTFYEGKGCLECDGTGFHGRMAIAELLDLSDRIRGLILERRPAADIKKAAKEEGMTFLRDAALAKVLEGWTTLQGNQQGHVRRLMKIPFLRPVVPPARVLPPSGGSHVRDRPPRSPARVRAVRGTFPFPPNTRGRRRVRNAALHARGDRAGGRGGAPAVGGTADARARSSFRIRGRGSCRSRWRRFRTPSDAAREMVQWKLKKLLPGRHRGAVGRLPAR